MNDLWVFAYGSLMWQPGFDYLDAQPALLRGYHRAFCVYSHIYRGTPERPGLVLGLDRGGSCRGTAYRVHRSQAGEVLDYLNEREMRTSVYHPRFLAMTVPGRRIRAHTFVVRRGHRQYAGPLPIARLVALVLQGEGTKGRCRDYLERTVCHLRERACLEPRLERLHGHVLAAERLRSAAG